MCIYCAFLDDDGDDGGGGGGGGYFLQTITVFSVRHLNRFIYLFKQICSYIYIYREKERRHRGISWSIHDQVYSISLI